MLCFGVGGKRRFGRCWRRKFLVPCPKKLTDCAKVCAKAENSTHCGEWEGKARKRPRFSTLFPHFCRRAVRNRHSFTVCQLPQTADNSLLVTANSEQRITIVLPASCCIHLVRMHISRAATATLLEEPLTRARRDEGRYLVR